MRRFLMFVLLVLWSLPAFAQETLWSRTYGGSLDDKGFCVRQTQDGGYMVAGATSSFGAGNVDVYLIKTGLLGDTIWSRTYGGISQDVGISVQQTMDGGYMVAGYTTLGVGLSDVYLIKTDSLGDPLWSRTYGGSNYEYCYSIQQTTDGGYIVAGHTESFDFGYEHVYLIKTDSLGDTLWSRTYGGGNWEQGFSVQQTTDGGYIMVGHTFSFGVGFYDVYLIKTDSLGEPLWSRTYGGSDSDYGRSVQQTTDGGYIVTGYTESFGAGLEDLYLIKTDSLGDTLWSRTYGGSDSDLGFSVQQTTDGGYVVAGVTYSFGNGEIYLIRTDSTGDTLWTRIFGHDSINVCYSVQQTTDGGYIVAGVTGHAPFSFDFMLTRLDSLGNACIGEFVSPTVMSVSCTVTSPATEVTSPATEVTSPATIVTSPATEVTTVCVAIRGDANGSGSVDLADAVFVVNWLFIGGPAPDPLWLGDANCSGSVDLADAVYIVNWLFIGGPPPGC
jgi:hypothetical protein